MDGNTKEYGVFVSQTEGIPDFKLYQEKEIVGRSDEHGITSDYISVVHAEIYYLLHRNRHMTIMRDSSMNGTYLNGDKLDKGKLTIINPLDEISILKPSQPVSIKFCYRNLEDEMNENKKCHVYEKYDIKEFLGSGGMAVVRKVVRKSDGKVFALKRVVKKDIDGLRKEAEVSNDPKQKLKIEKNIKKEEKKIISVKRECDIMVRINHQYIVGFEEYLEGDSAIYIIMEYIDGVDLFSIIFRNESLTVEFIAKIMKQLLESLLYLHEHNIIHRDIKPENIMITKEGHDVKLTDFGFGRVVDGTHKAKSFVVICIWVYFVTNIY